MAYECKIWYWVELIGRTIRFICSWIVWIPMVESWLFSSLMLVEAHNWHQWNDESIKQEGWAVDIHFSLRLEYLSSYLKRPCCLFREQLTWLMSLCWDREGCTSHWGIKNDQDHHQNLHNLPCIKGKHERSWIPWHALGGTEISVSLKKSPQKWKRNCC